LNILAIETGSRICQLGLAMHGERYIRQLAIQSHSQVILQLVDELLDQASASLGDIEGICVNHGPGSFTGVRVGVSVAQGLALAQDLPLIGISALEILAMSAVKANPQHFVTPANLLCAIDARKAQIYAAWYAASLDDSLATSLETATPLLGGDSGDNSHQQINLELLSEPCVIEPAKLDQEECERMTRCTAAYKTGSGLHYVDQLAHGLQDLPSLASFSNNSVLEHNAELDMDAMLDLAQSKAALFKTSSAYIEPIYIRNNVTY